MGVDSLFHAFLYNYLRIRRI